ncbi:MAG: FtsX-like permease family protein [Phycisphaerae bacterium]|jgi:putative ABC transport system permease protein
MILTRYMLREVRRRPGRSVLTLLGIVIGVQALVAIPLTLQSMRQAQRGVFEALAGKAALEVVPCGQGGFSPDIGPALESVSGVTAAVPAIQSTAAIQGSSGPVPVTALGVEMSRDDRARDYVVRRGKLLTDDAQVLLEQGFAESLGLNVGATLQLLSPSGATELRVTGLLAPRGVAAVNGGAVAIMPLATAQRLHRLEGQINSLDLVLADGADREQVAQEVSRRLPAGLTVQVPASRAALAQETLANTELMLTALSVTSLVAGAFVILNSFLMSLGERRRSLAILRSLGATRRQVTHLLLSEALALGVIGTIIGIPLGLAAAWAMTRMMAQFSDPVVPQLRLSAGPLVLAALVGPGVALLSTYFPARTAGRRSPLAELSGRPETKSSGAMHARRWSGYLGLGLLTVFALIFIAILTGRLSNATLAILMPVSMALVLVGSALAVPVALGPLWHVVERLLRPILGIEASLAIRQLRRHPTRTSLVVGVLLISVMLSSGFGNAILNSLRNTREWMVRTFANLDFLVVPTALSGTEFLPVTMPEGCADRIADLEGVHHVGKGTVFATRAAGQQVIVFARTCAPGEDPGFRIVGGDEDKVRAGLRRGEVVIGTGLAQRAQLQPGDQISIETRRGPRSFRITGLTPEYTAGGLLVLVEWDRARQLFDMQGVRYIYVVADPDDRAGVERSLRDFCNAHRLIVYSRTSFTSTCDRMIAGVINSACVLLALVFVVASLGVTNCVTMNALEQTRELGILRAIAMKRRQVFRMFIAQALAIGVISTIPGILLGVLVSYAAVRTHLAIAGARIAYVLEPTLLLGCAAMAVGVAVLASLPAARRAARLTITRALQYE